MPPRTSACWSSQFVTSQRRAIATSSPPSSAASSRSRSSERAPSTSRQPAAAAWRAVAAPMPVLAPVISITLPSAMALVLSLRVRGAMDDATRARFPDVPQAAGHYESYYMRAAHPTEPLGVWIRYTVHKRPDALPTASLWFTLFDDAAEGPLASKVTHPHSELAAGGERYIEIAGSTFGPQRVAGEARTDACDAAWELEISDGEPQLLHLPRAGCTPRASRGRRRSARTPRRSSAVA